MKDSEQQYAQTGIHILGPHSDAFMTFSKVLEKSLTKCWQNQVISFSNFLPFVIDVLNFFFPGQMTIFLELNKNFRTCISVRKKTKQQDIKPIICEFDQKTENPILH